MDSFHWVIWPVLLYSLGIAAAIDALWQSRTAQGTAAWVIALLLMPLVSLPFYLLFGSRRFSGYRKARRQGDNKLSAQERQIRNSLVRISLNPMIKHWRFNACSARLCWKVTRPSY